MAGNAVEKGEVRTHHGVGDPSPSCTDPPSSQSSAKSTWPSFTSTKSLLSGGTDNGTIVDENRLEAQRLPKQPKSLLKRLTNVFTRETHQLPPLVRSLKGCLEGYPSLATFLDSDENFMLYRRFGYIQSRLLLDKQDELRKLEERLEECDIDTAAVRPENLQTRDLAPEDAPGRQQIMKQLETAFNEYATLMGSAQQFVSMNRPSSFDYTSVARYISQRHPLVAEEQSWIQWKEDMVTLRPGREHAWLDAAIEYVLRWIKLPIVQSMFRSEVTKQKSDGVGIYYTRSRIERLVVVIITVVILLLLVVPIYILYHLVNTMGTRKTDATCIGTLLVFTLAFSAVLSLFTRARRHEILGAAAAYCAVLVVFLGNVGNNR